MQLPNFVVDALLSVEAYCNQRVFENPDSSSRFIAAFLIPFLVSVASVAVGLAVFETLVRIPAFEKYHIRYNGKKHRFDDYKRKLAPTPFHDPDLAESICDAALTIFVGAVGMFMLGLDELSVRGILDTSRIPASSLVVQLMVRLVLIDFVAYIVHYACHANDFLWKYVHGKHHRSCTPTGLTASVGGMMDSLFNASLPHLIATLALQDHPLVVYTSMFCWGIDSIAIHSGMSIPFMNLLPLNFVPLRASPRQHDLHHFSSGRKLVDLGFMLWIWDWMFGTASEAAGQTARGMWTDYGRAKKPVSVSTWAS